VQVLSLVAAAALTVIDEGGPKFCPRCGERCYGAVEIEQHNRDVHNFGPVATTTWGAEP
jgi:hypothetical protein